MRGDLRLLRPRWWGAFVLIPVALLAAVGFLSVAFDPPWHVGRLVGLIALSVTCVLFALSLYAPWTCHWATRAVGGIVCIGYLAYVVDEIREARWWSGGRASPSVVNALIGLMVFGMPGYRLLRRPRSRVDPYDRAGVYLGSHATYTIRLRGECGEPYSERSRETVAAMIRDVDPDNITTCIEGWEEPCVMITVPRDDVGLGVWRRIEERLHADGVVYEVAIPPPVPRTTEPPSFAPAAPGSRYEHENR